MIQDMINEEPSLDQPTALRFLYGRKFDKVRALASYKSYRESKEKYNLQNVTIQDVEKELRTGKIIVPGTFAKDGSILFVINAERHDPKQFPKEKTLALAFYLAEYATKDLESQKKGITIVSNLSGIGWSNFDAEFQKSIISLFTNALPISLKHILLFDPPWMINMFVKIVSPFLKQKIRQRVFHF